MRKAANGEAWNDDWSKDQFEFLDDIHGAIHLNRLERDLVDTHRLSAVSFASLSSDLPI